jgi:L-ascorbate metabolism protein UlaG (beta-lactamase superfamily)
VIHGVLGWAGLLAVIALVALVAIWLSTGDSTGSSVDDARLERHRQSAQWNAAKKRFGNRLKRVDGSFLEMGARFLFGGSKHRQAELKESPLVHDLAALQGHPASGLRVSWLGHSSFLVAIDGIRTLVDPVFGERASPFSWSGPKRFYPPPYPLEELGELDAIVISHDHYDHLDREAVALLLPRELPWIVPLGVGAHLEGWGVDRSLITELDWWEETRVKDVTITATPSRHFSGRAITMTDQNATLWAGWAWTGPTRKLFYSGDTAMHPEFAEIGDRLGPFDLTLMETGAYNQLWCDVHLGPEQAALAHRLVQGNVMMPAHWGTFDLALHGWTEPAERVIVAAKELGIDLAMIRPGATYDIASQPGIDRWWPQAPWESAQDSPAWSTSVEALVRPLRDPGASDAP